MKTETWSNSQQARELLARQRLSWPAAQAGYQALEKVEVKLLHIDGLPIKLQYNPARIISSGAKTDALSIRKRSCFLCPAHLPPEQEGLPMGNDYLLLCNPYPIFPEHFTIAARRHVEQQIFGSIPDFLKMARQLSDFSLFYNGPESGASAPDHLHFQAVTRFYMPIDEEAGRHKGECLLEEEGVALYLLSGYLRNGFILEATNEAAACALFKRLHHALWRVVEGFSEPLMNIFCHYEDSRWQIIIIPRNAHRPRQYYSERSDFILTSPGAADIGGVFITPRKEDFDKMTPELLLDIYQQIAYSDAHISRFAEELFKD
jgi:hypothetical protein